MQVGELDSSLLLLIGLTIKDKTPIYLSETNLRHMRNSHPADYQNYGQYIPQILSQPDYIGAHSSDGSIEFVKEFGLGPDFVKVAVRISRAGRYFVRSLYTLNPQRVRRFIQKGTLMKVPRP